MAINEDQLARLNADYTALTGKVVEGFVCPVTLQDDPHAELCDGHVLNEGIKKASRVTVIQRKDVDNYYGRTIEPDLVEMLNAPVSTPQELVRRARDLTITTPSGDKLQAFFGNSKARKRFQQVDLRNRDGTPFASPFLKAGELEARLYKGLEVEWTMTVTNSAVVGSFVKSSYLALFRMLGYRWVHSADGDKVRRALAAFYHNKASKEQSLDYFSEFSGSIAVVLSDAFDDVEDTLEGGSLLFHYAEGDRITGLLFAVTCLFRVNDRVVTVTLPCSQREGYYFVAIRHYQAFLNNRSMPHSVYFGRYYNEHFEISTTPLRLLNRTDLP
jgi:hypothetical protein